MTLKTPSGQRAAWMIGLLSAITPAIVLAASPAPPERTSDVMARHARCMEQAQGEPARQQRCHEQALAALDKRERALRALLDKKTTQTQEQQAAHRAELGQVGDERRQLSTSLAQAKARVTRDAQQEAGLGRAASSKAQPNLASESARQAPAPVADAMPASRRPLPAKAPQPKAKPASASGSVASGHIASLSEARAQPTPSSMSSPTRPRPEPSAQPDPSAHADEAPFKHHGTQAMVDTAKERFSTFAADVDTGSYTIMRGQVRAGVLPPAASVRVEEFVNFFRYSYPAPAQGAFSVALEAAPSPFVAQADRYVMRVGVQGKVLSAQERKPVHLVFLVDVSGSMNRHDKLGLAKEALKVLTNNLRPEDTVAIATYASGSRVVLEPTGIKEKAKILAALDDLRAGGSTAMNDGLGLAYKLALTHYKRDHIHRVIVMSDGDANVGPSGHQAILKEIKKYVDEGVTLSTIGLGMGSYRDQLMEQLANQGNGNYYYIDSMQEANRIFSEQIDGTLQVIAKDVKLQVEFNPEAVAQHRLIGYENRVMTKEEFRDDQKDAGEIGAGHTVTALYEVVLKPASPQQPLLATVRVRHKTPQGHEASEASFELRRAELRSKLSQASADLQFATAVAAYAELLRGSPYAKGLSYDLVYEVAQASATSAQADRQEFLGLVKQAKTIAQSQAARR